MLDSDSSYNHLLVRLAIRKLDLEIQNFIVIQLKYLHSNIFKFDILELYVVYIECNVFRTRFQTDNQNYKKDLVEHYVSTLDSIG